MNISGGITAPGEGVWRFPSKYISNVLKLDQILKIANICIPFLLTFPQKKIFPCLAPPLSNADATTDYVFKYSSLFQPQPMSKIDCTAQ